MKTEASNFDRKYVEEIINEIITSKFLKNRKTSRGLGSSEQLPDDNKVVSSEKCQVSNVLKSVNNMDASANR